MPVWIYSRWDCYRLGAAKMLVTETPGSSAFIILPQSTGCRFYHGDNTHNTFDGALPTDGGTMALGPYLKYLLNSAGFANTYDVTWAPTTGLYTIARATGTATFALAFSAYGDQGQRMRRWLGYSADKSTATSHASDRSPHFWLGFEHGRSRDSGRQPLDDYPRGDVAIGGANQAHATGPVSIPYGRRWEQHFLGPTAVLNSRDTTGGDVWTLERFFEHHRLLERFLFFPEGTSTFKYANRDRAYKLTQDGISGVWTRKRDDRVETYWTSRFDCIEMDEGDPTAAEAVLLDLATVGTFTRSTEGSYLTSATSFAFAGVDVRRMEDRGDGYGPRLLLEGAATNINTESEDIDSSGAWGQENLTGSDGYMVAPDGSIEGDRLISSASGAGYNREFLYALIGASSTYTFSVWYRDGTVNTGAHDYSIGIGVRESVGSTLVYTTVDIPPTGTWTRASVTKTAQGTTEGYSLLYVNGNGQSGPRAAVGDDVVYYGAQLELGRSPTSYIRSTAGSTTARGADTLQVVPASVPLQMRQGRWQQPVCLVDGSSDLVSGDIRVLYSFDDANNSLRIRHDGTGVRVEAYQASAVRAASNYLTFSRHQRLIITIDAPAATITVSGATTGDGIGAAGTAWAWACATAMRVGGNASGTAEAFAGLFNPRSA